jgi:hypothetical protein
VNKIRRVVILVALPLLYPAWAFSQNGAAEPPGEFRALLTDRGISWEEGFLFSASGGGDEAARDPSLLIFFPGSAASSRGEDSAGTVPLMIAAFPLRGGEGPGEGPAYCFALALALAGQLRAREAAGRGLPGDLLIAFLGDGDLRQYRKTGSRSAGELSSYGGIIREPETTVFWFFDLEDAPSSVLVHHGTAQTIAPLESLKNLAGLFSSLKIPYKFAVPFNEMYRLGLAGGPEILAFTQGQGMEALYFSGSPGPGKGARGSVGEEALGELILSRAASLESPGENRDYHYLIFPLGAKTIFLSQEHSALVLFLMAAVFFLGFLLYRIFRPVPPARIMLFFRCFWTVPAFFLLLFVSLEAAGLAAGFLAGPETRIPLIYGWAVWKLLLGLGLFALISIPLGGYRIPRRAVFYGHCALLLIGLDIFIAAWADICFIPFFIGAFLLIFLGSRIKRPIPVYLCALLAPFYGFTAAVFSILSGYGGLGTFLLSSGPAPTALMILVFLPFVLLFKRAMNLQRREKSNILRRLIPFFIFLGLTLILGITLSAAR